VSAPGRLLIRVAGLTAALFAILSGMAVHFALVLAAGGAG